MLLRLCVLACVVRHAGALAFGVPATANRCCHRAGFHPRMLEPPFPLPYEVPPLPKAYSDYEWDDSYPGTFKPGKREEMYSTQDVFDLWEGKENPACIELRQDELWAVPTPPPEDILSWLDRIGLLSDEGEETDDGQEKEITADSSLLDDEFDLEDGEDGEGAEVAINDQILETKESGATMSDFL